MSSNYRIRKEDILQATNNGLDIILYYYPQSQKCVDRKGEKFKMRDSERTASATLKQLPDGNWVVTDFGDDAKPRNAIAVCMLEEGLDFGSAIRLLAERYAVASDEEIKSLFQPVITTDDAEPDQKEKEWLFEPYDEIPNNYIEALFSELIIKGIDYDKRNIADPEERKKATYDQLRKTCSKLHYFALKSYTIIKNRKAIKIASTEFYPIFLIEEKGFKKIYQPKSQDKGKRFMYYGEVDKNFLHGYDQAQVAFNALQNQGEQFDEEGNAVEAKVEKLPELIYCTGGSDALNIAALGYEVVWPSSEYYKLTAATVKKFFAIAKDVMTAPDLDLTGQKQNHRLCMDDSDPVFLDIKTIALPEELKQKRDFRGNACKDVRDYLRFYSRKDFKSLVATALPYRFWDVTYTKNSKIEYKPNNLRMYNFLMKNGFFRFKSENDKNGYIFIHIDGNIVRAVDDALIKNFIYDFLEKRKMDENLRNAFYRTNQLGEASLSALKMIDIDFTDFDKHTQYFFFENNTWKVTKDGIEAFKSGDVDKLVWDKEVIKHKVKKLDDFFTINHNEELDEYDIDIKNTDCLFFRYLINASRIHWKKELEDSLAGEPMQVQEEYQAKHKFSIDGPNLTAEEIKEQKLHLINKIYSIGYLLHRYKDPSRPWCVFAMDHKLTDDGLSHGGSGKSIAYKSVREFMTSVTLEGRNPKLTDNPHVFERVSVHTDYVLIDDANKGLKFDFFFSMLTGEMVVNPKNNKQFEIPFEQVPKLCITSNFTPNEIDPSTERRLLYTVFSDYYHFSTNGEYNESRSPKDDLGKNLFLDFNEKEWNDFCNFMAQCCRWYMNFSKIAPPMGNVMARNYMNQIGVNFLGWADIYFSEEGGKRDSYVIKQVANDDFIKETKTTGWTAQAFSKRLKLWAAFRGLTLNPKDLRNADGRMVKTLPAYEFDIRSKTWAKTGSTKTTEVVYIQTPGKPLTDAVNDPTAEPSPLSPTPTEGIGENVITNQSDKKLPF
jgi:hypothetical protein